MLYCTSSASWAPEKTVDTYFWVRVDMAVFVSIGTKRACTITPGQWPALQACELLAPLLTEHVIRAARAQASKTDRQARKLHGNVWSPSEVVAGRLRRTTYTMKKETHRESPRGGGEPMVTPVPGSGVHISVGNMSTA